MPSLVEKNTTYTLRGKISEPPEALAPMNEDLRLIEFSVPSSDYTKDMIQIPSIAYAESDLKPFLYAPIRPGAHFLTHYAEMLCSCLLSNGPMISPIMRECEFSFNYHSNNRPSGLFLLILSLHPFSLSCQSVIFRRMS